MRLAFMGTPDFAVPALKALIGAGHEIAAVYCQPPRPAHRGQVLTLSPVHRLALDHGLDVRTPLKLKDASEHQAFAALGLDLAIVAAYGLILPQTILDAPRLGCINIHASLLPRWRGAAPIHRAIEAGDKVTGITLMQMDAGLDTGAMLHKCELAIGALDTTGELLDRLANLGAQMIVEVVPKLAQGQITATPQSDQGVTYAAKITKEEARLDFNVDSEVLARKIHALSPRPGAFTQLPDGARLKILLAEPCPGEGAPGTVLDDAFTLACRRGALRPLKVQREGRGVQDVASFLRGQVLAPGARLGA